MNIHQRYIERKRIYSGPYSDVYLSVDNETTETVCLKIVDIDIRLPPHNIQREISLLKRMRNRKDILKYLNDYEWMDDRVLVTSYYEFTLDTLLKSKHSRKSTRFNFDQPLDIKLTLKNTLQQQDSRQLLIGLTKGLVYLHELGIIHRDLKPSNIFFRDDNIGEPIIGDFGISFDTNSENQGETNSHKYTDVCSGIFKPPELCLGVVDYCFEVDLWSLAIIMTIIYLNDLKSIMESDEEASANDLYLLNKIFSVFGTPHLDNSRPLELYWPEMDNETYYFKHFEFIDPKPRLPNEVIIPRADLKMADIFRKMTVYQRCNRIDAKELLDLLMKSEDK